MQDRAFGRGAVADMPDLGGQITRYRKSSRAATAGSVGEQFDFPA